jgi:2-iminobutanoate/2-iminopropanoate deaminase
MDKKVIHTNEAPAAVGPYEQAIAVDNFLFTSGQLGLSPETGELVQGIAAQTAQAIANLDAVLQAAGMTRENVVKTLIFLENINDFAVVNEIYGQYFGTSKPARSCVAVDSLPKGGLVEIEAVAVSA